MGYYHTPTSTFRNPARLEAKVSDGRLIGPGDGVWSVELAAACGFVPVVTVPAPTVPDTEVAVRSLEVVNGTPTEVWTVRPKTAEELAEATAAVNMTDLQTKARAALAASATALTANATYIARTTTTTAQDKAQLKALSNQVNALIRQVNALTRLVLAADLLHDTAGT